MEELQDSPARESFPLMTVSAAKNAIFEFHLEDGHQ
jgi:hypothetical protein